jgi:hypothetical protein
MVTVIILSLEQMVTDYLQKTDVSTVDWCFESQSILAICTKMTKHVIDFLVFLYPV